MSTVEGWWFKSKPNGHALTGGFLSKNMDSVQQWYLRSVIVQFIVVQCSK